MLAAATLQEFKRYAGAKARNVSLLTGAEVVDLMLGFYRDVRAEDCDPGTDRDMLLFQWGTYDWGKGPRFEFDVTRQLMLPHGDPEDVDENLWQLHVTLRLAPSADLRGLGRGDRWCHSVVDLDGFERAIRSGAAYRAVGTRSGEVDVAWECAG